MGDRVLPVVSSPVLPASDGHGAALAWPRDSGAWPGETLWLPRADAEADERYLQLIPYALLRNGRGDLWCYCRHGGDARLRERFSCGVGGHVDREDEDATLGETLWNTLQRELGEELNWQPPPEPIEPVAWIYEGLSPIGRVHLGLLYLLDWYDSDPPSSVDPALAGIGFRPAPEILAEPRFELWSRLAAQYVSGENR
ncbi:NUDIX domain-containing protein [Methylococcus sp. ANG]|uniref:NUDIX domain-containing protein n=1 Tax=Methylococcus sp. ANG TaxID=3231903 RepID=UPI003459E867